MTKKWLSVNEVSKILGVHPSTVRIWADEGRLPVYRTAGGHRRFSLEEIELWKSKSRQDKGGVLDDEEIASNILRRVHFNISKEALAQESWYQKLSEESRMKYRRTGGDFLQGLLHSLTSKDMKDILLEAEALGYEYAAYGRRAGLTYVEGAKAFLFFRKMLFSAITEVYQTSMVSNHLAWKELLNRLGDFTDAVLISLLKTYYSLEQNHPKTEPQNDKN